MYSELIGESIQGTALVYDSEGNLINKEDAESVSGLYDWENCPMIQQIEDETAIPIHTRLSLATAAGAIAGGVADILYLFRFRSGINIP